MPTALIIGTTGLVGTALLKQLISDERFSLIKSFGRRTTGLQHPKLEEHVIDFGKPEDWKHLVHGDVLFSTLGTTLKQAGSKDAQYKVDYQYQYNMASAASENGVPVYVLVSSMMASTESKIFYTRMKGELERDIKKLPFKSISILQPGMLAGERKEYRPGEKAGLAAIRFLNRIGIARKHKPIDASLVARAMINVSFNTATLSVYAQLKVFEAAGERP